MRVRIDRERCQLRVIPFYFTFSLCANSYTYTFCPSPRRLPAVRCCRIPSLKYRVRYGRSRRCRRFRPSLVRYAGRDASSSARSSARDGVIAIRIRAAVAVPPMRDAVDVFPPDIRPRSSYRVRTARRTRRRASPMTSSSSAALTARPRIFIVVPIIRRPASVSRLRSYPPRLRPPLSSPASLLATRRRLFCPPHLLTHDLRHPSPQ